MDDQPDRNAGILVENPRSVLRISHQPLAGMVEVSGQTRTVPDRGIEQPAKTDPDRADVRGPDPDRMPSRGFRESEEVRQGRGGAGAGTNF
jgi:hypothetical protein